MFPSLSEAQRHAVDQEGTPLPVMDVESGQAYLLVAVQFLPGIDGSVIAHLPGLGIFGEGDSPEEAAMSLAVATRMLSES